ncbi:alpha/beta hydrolase [Risungbinella massiliensis]|uniref:alpha/beta hydrolase n=1 Tax=Risungbinella massiliensis TaxID=1329796 RepID=UPI0005CBAE0B|nr:alpha/beta hydrolase [Risungbinella massiliensis]
MKHFFEKGNDPQAPVLLLLHGTGGDERDLVPLKNMISPGSSVLSVRGNVLENGMPRFFRRLSMGVFDEEDLVFRTKELNEFLNQAAIDYQFDRSHVVAVGYSNGANIAASLLFHYAGSLAGAILLHPMVPRRGITLPDHSGIPVLLTAGRQDPICPPEETEELEKLLQSTGAEVKVQWQSGGHQLTMPEIEQAAKWFQTAFRI